MSDSTLDGVLSMNQVISSLLNEEIKRKTTMTDNTQTFVAKKRERSKSRGPKCGHGRSRGGSQVRKTSRKCFHRKGHITMNCFGLKKEQKEANIEE